eukprot:Tamp_23655.p1 GENE.Tamp_23655~~Tamp_23655.p1  ORF type:complete len:167 (+),score=12.50 Tamp_23655:220-720(+)
MRACVRSWCSRCSCCACSAMGGSGSKEDGNAIQVWGCCGARSQDSRPPSRFATPISGALCGVGMGLDSVQLNNGRGAVVTCLAKGGPAQAEGGLRIGDTVEYVNALHVPSLLKHRDSEDSPSTALAQALLGEVGSTIRIGVRRAGEEGILYVELKRAPLKPGSSFS